MGVSPRSGPKLLLSELQVNPRLDPRLRRRIARAVRFIQSGKLYEVRGERARAHSDAEKQTKYGCERVGC